MRRILAATILAAVTWSALGAGPLPKQDAVPPSGPPAAANPPLPELRGVLSWKTLSRVEEVKTDNRIGPKFSAEIAALDSRVVKLQGFMLPLEPGKKQQRFLLSANVPSCPFCMPGGPESLVEVRCKEAIAFDAEPIIISGKFGVLKNDPTGLWYRVTEATLVRDARN
jgi:uncharacterized protein